MANEVTLPPPQLPPTNVVYKINIGQVGHGVTLNPLKTRRI